jgi:hypothetical protein
MLMIRFGHEMEPVMATSPVLGKLSFVARRRKQIKRWWHKFFIEEAYIPEDVRKICERYGEQVISTMLAGNSSPSTPELRSIFQTDETREYARAWLSETTSYSARRDHWISLRDFLLEITVIALILWEIRSGYRQDDHQSKNFDKQQIVLGHLVESSDKTVQTLDALKQTTESMKDAVQKELVEAQRSAKAAERSAKASEASSKTATDALHISERSYLAVGTAPPTPPKAGEKLHFEISVSNSGKTPATEVVILSKYVVAVRKASEDLIRATILTMTLPKSETSVAVLAAGQQTSQILESPIPLQEGQVTTITEATIVLYLVTDVTYKDVFNHPHHVQTCAYYDANLKKMSYCSFMNQAD